MRLIDCFIEVITYTSYLLRDIDREQPAFEDIRGNYTRLFDRAEACFKEGKFSSQAWDMSRFAVCAWVDEAISCSSWNGRTSWEHQQLQRVYYKSTNAGEGFFDRLSELEPEAAEVREVYAYCLALGFKGKYFREENEPQLENISSANLEHVMDKALLKDYADDTVSLFPGAYSASQDERHGHKSRSPFSLFTVTFLVWPPVLFGVLFFMYRDMLRNLIEGFFGKGF